MVPVIPAGAGRQVLCRLLSCSEPCLMPAAQASVNNGARTVLLHKKAFCSCCYQDLWPHFCGASLSLLSGRATLEASPVSGWCLWLRMNSRQLSKASRKSWEPRRRANRRSRGRRCWRARRAAGSSKRDSSIRSRSGSSGAGMAGSLTSKAIQNLGLPLRLPLTCKDMGCWAEFPPPQFLPSHSPDLNSWVTFAFLKPFLLAR